ncbi:hypothetical protein LXL04_025622 [Taraxacum kok-saghyz]
METKDSATAPVPINISFDQINNYYTKNMVVLDWTIWPGKSQRYVIWPSLPLAMEAEWVKPAANSNGSGTPMVNFDFCSFIPVHVFEYHVKCVGFWLYLNITG